MQVGIKEPEFIPITLTLETQAEVDWIISYVGHFMTDSGKTISDIINEVLNKDNKKGG